jgi:hypothetical protein
LDLPDKSALVNLQKLLYVGLVFRMPVGLVRFLVRLPLTRIYSVLFGIGMVWGLSRINKSSLYSIARLSLLQLSRYNRTGQASAEIKIRLAAPSNANHARHAQTAAAAIQPQPVA